MFKEALKVDFTYASSMYNISVQYRRLGLEDAELDTLILLVKVWKFIAMMTL